MRYGRRWHALVGSKPPDIRERRVITFTGQTMNLYRLALFVHLVAVIVAAGVTAVTKLAVGRRIRARSVAS